jgi:hypothetical protein
MENPRAPLLGAATSRAIIDTFRDVHRALGFGYRFGREAKFYRVICENRLKHRST